MVETLCLVPLGVLHLRSVGEGYGSPFASLGKDLFKMLNDARKGFVAIDEDKVRHPNLQQVKGRFE